MMIASLKKSQRGYLVLDATAALILLTGGVLLTLNGLRGEVRSGRDTFERRIAQHLAESELERLAALGYDEIPVGDGQRLALRLPSAERLHGVAGRLSVSEQAPGLKKATVAIRWERRGGMETSVSATRLYARLEGRP